MKLQLKQFTDAAVLMTLLAVWGCRTPEPQKYADLVKIWHPIAVYQSGDGSHIVIVQSITNGVEVGKYIWPMYSSRGPEGGGRVLSGWCDRSSCSMIKLGPREGLATVFEYRRSQPDGAADRSQPFSSETNRTSSAADSRR